MKIEERVAVTAQKRTEIERRVMRPASGRAAEGHVAVGRWLWAGEERERLSTVAGNLARMRLCVARMQGQPGRGRSRRTMLCFGPFVFWRFPPQNIKILKQFRSRSGPWSKSGPDRRPKKTKEGTEDRTEWFRLSPIRSTSVFGLARLWTLNEHPYLVANLIALNPRPPPLLTLWFDSKVILRLCVEPSAKSIKLSVTIMP